MQTARGKAVALWIAATVLAVATVAGTGYALKDRILEGWYLRKLESSDASDRKAAVSGLRALDSVRALPMLAELLRPLAEKDNAVRNAAAYALGKIAPREAAIPYLVRMLRGQDVPEHRRFAAWALGEIGRPASTAVPALREVLQDPHEPTRGAAATALKKIQGE